MGVGGNGYGGRDDGCGPDAYLGDSAARDGLESSSVVISWGGRGVSWEPLRMILTRLNALQYTKVEVHICTFN